MTTERFPRRAAEQQEAALGSLIRDFSIGHTPHGSALRTSVEVRRLMCANGYPMDCTRVEHLAAKFGIELEFQSKLSRIRPTEWVTA